MPRNTSPLPVFAAIILLNAVSCRHPGHPQTCIKANAVSGRSGVRYQGPLRMFSRTGEITDPAVITGYQNRHGIVMDSSRLVYSQPDDVYSNHSEAVYYGSESGSGPAKTNDVVIMRQQDTGALGPGAPQGAVDYLFKGEQDFLMMRGQLLDMHESFTKLERIDEQNYRMRESFHVKGRSMEDGIRVPYTFMANRVRVGSYPYALRPGAMPRVPAGDTLLVREGYLALN